MIRILELFSGTHSVGKVCKKKGWYIVSLDRDLGDDDNISDLHIREDIMTWDYKKYPKDSFDVIWASPVCLWWSALRNTWIGRPLKGMDRPFTSEDLYNDIEKYGVPMVDKVREIIDYFYPKYYFIENPKTGKMKDYIVDLPFYDVDYCKYSDWGYKKSTRFWTNVEGFIPKICHKDCENIITIKTKEGDIHPGYKTQIKGDTRTLHKKCIGVIKVDPDHDVIKSVKPKEQKFHKECMGCNKLVLVDGKYIRVNTKELGEKYKDYPNLIKKPKEQKLHSKRMGCNKLIEDNGVMIRCTTKALRIKYKDYPDLTQKKNQKHKANISDFGGGTNRLERYRIPEKLIVDLLENI